MNHSKETFMKIFQQKKLFFVLVTAFILCISTNSFAENYKHIVAFGDSLSDHGGLSDYNDIIVANGGQGAPESWTNNGAAPYGGDVWLDYLQDEWNTTLDNNAIGGAMTLGHENAGIQALIDAGLLPDLGLTGQVTAYLASSPVYNSETTLFAIWIGGNDCLEFFRGEYYTADPTALIADSVGRIITQMGALYADGARKFLIINLPDLAKTPAFNTKDPATQAQVRGVVTGFNAALASGLTGFASSHTDATLHSIDAFTYLNSIIADDVFDNSTLSYLKVDDSCNWDLESFNGTFDQFLFFDCIHPTTKAHELVAGKVADTIPNDNDDDDDSCFIQTVSENSNVTRHIAILPGVFMVMGIAGYLLRRK